MLNKYYLLSKDIGDGPYLLGELVRLSRGEYSFRYMIKGNRFPEWFMEIPEMRDMGRIYDTEEVKNFIIHRITPRESTWLANELMKQNGITIYDEWDILESQMETHDKYKVDKYPLSDSHEHFYFYPEIPRRVNRYDQ
jgi:hypothetical protein